MGPLGTLVGLDMKMTLFNCRYSLYLSLSLVKALHTLSRKSPEFWTENGADGHSVFLGVNASEPN